MEKFDHIDGQMLGAFVDGLLDDEYTALVIKAMEVDPEVRNQVYQLRRAKDLMKLGFGNTSASSGNRRKYHKSFWSERFPRVAAAIAVIAVSFGAGKLSHHYFEPFEHDTTFASVAQEAPEKIILHITESDPVKFHQALEYTETFLHEHQDSGARIEVVANAGGIDLMRKDKSSLASKVASMIREYDNVHFIACANAIRKLRSKGIEPEFVDGVHTRETVMDYIISRIKEGGWTYLKVDSLQS
jgi:intracellular sulfur oxidation DsrE/DsrF family protein